MENKGNTVVLTEAEKRLIELIRNVEYGELHIFVRSGEPVRAEEIRRSILLK